MKQNTTPLAENLRMATASILSLIHILDVETMLASISKGAAGSWQMTNNAPKMVAGDMAPGFFIKHFIKDMAIADEEAKAAGLTMPVLEDVLEMYRDLDRRGEGDLGTQAVIRCV